MLIYKTNKQKKQQKTNFAFICWFKERTRKYQLQKLKWDDRERHKNFIFRTLKVYKKYFVG